MKIQRFALVLFVALVLINHTALAQIKFEAKTAGITEIERIKLAKTFDEYEVYTMDFQAFDTYVKSNKQQSIFTFEFGEEHDWEIEIEENDLRSPNYVAIRSTENGRVLVPPGPCITYAGHVVGHPELQVRLNIEPNRTWGFIEGKAETYYIEPEQNFVKSAGSNKLVVYKESSIKTENIGDCGAESHHKPIGKSIQDGGPKSSGADCRKLEISTESDYELVEEGVSFSDILGNLNLVEANYENYFDMTFLVVFQHEWTTSSDPYSLFVSGCGGFGQLDEFEDEWADNWQQVRQDINVLYTGKNYAGDIVGCANTGSFGDNVNNDFGAYCVNQWFLGLAFSPAAARRTLVAHEMGHIFGAQHDDSNCGVFGAKNIMCASLWPSNTFLSPAIDEIEDGLTFESNEANDGRSAIRQRYTGTVFPAVGFEIVSIDAEIHTANEWILDQALWVQDNDGTTGTFRATDYSLLKPGFYFNAQSDETLKIDIGDCDVDGP